MWYVSCICRYCESACRKLNTCIPTKKLTLTMSTEKKSRFLLLYGSQTGQAEAIAEEIFQSAGSHGLEPEMHCLSQTEKKFNIVQEKCVVFVVSTTGDGDAPDTAVKFWRRLKRKTLPSDHLRHLSYTLLGLGDSNYTSFCKNGKNFDHRLEELGASRFYPAGFADDGVGLEIVVEPWIEGLWDALKKQLGLVCDRGDESGRPKELNSQNGVENNISEISDTKPGISCNGDSTELENVKSDKYKTVKNELSDKVTTTALGGEDCGDADHVTDGCHGNSNEENSSAVETKELSINKDGNETDDRQTALGGENCGDADHVTDSCHGNSNEENSSAVQTKEQSMNKDGKETDHRQTALEGENCGDADHVTDGCHGNSNEENSSAVQTKVQSMNKDGEETDDRQTALGGENCGDADHVTDGCHGNSNEENSSAVQTKEQSMNKDGKEMDDRQTALGGENCGDADHVTDGCHGNSNEENSSAVQTKGQSMNKDGQETDDARERTVNGNTNNENDISFLMSELQLSERSLTLPAVPPPYLRVEYHPDDSVDLSALPIHGGAAFPSATSNVVMATVTAATRLTQSDAVKTCLKVELDISNTGLTYMPGDSIGVVCPNSEDEVNFLIERLSLQDKADVTFTLHLIENTAKKRAQVPAFVPEKCTLRYALLHCLDIRTPPKKAFLRMLAEYTETEKEKRCLQELCSRQGSDQYEKLLRLANLSVIDILVACPSCRPPIERLLEMLPRLQARPYSAASSPLENPGRMSIAFNIIEIPRSDGRHSNRQGVCTGWLDRVTRGLQEGDTTHNAILVPIFSRSNKSFHLAEDPETPMVMIGPGTGVAPFVGFLQHRQKQQLESPALELGQTWLFFGCRHRDRDFIFRDELEKFRSCGVLSKLCTCFSRDGDTSQPRYVQDMMRVHQEEIARLLLEQSAVVYVCGDAKHMARDVYQTWMDIFSRHLDVNLDEAKKIMSKLKEDGRYLEDIWT